MIDVYELQALTLLGDLHKLLNNHIAIYMGYVLIHLLNPLYISCSHD